jgi:5-hydroxyisourate hydrolase-like protein (transthyretin family)
MKNLRRLLGVSVLGVIFVLPSLSFAAGNFDVTAPNGGQKWVTGKAYAIKWAKGNAGAQVKIQLLKSGKHYQWISKKTKNDGKYAWEVPTTVVTGSAYKIKITSIKNKKVIDVSDKVFSITKRASRGGTDDTDDTDDTDALEVTTPNGGQKWKIGKAYAIKWVVGNGGSYVKIQLYKSGKHYQWISKKTKNDGKYPWKIPSTVKAGSAYKIKITAKTKNSITDSSDKNFTISKSGGGGSGSLKVTVPNGDETWKPNTVHVIKWDKGDAGKFVRIFLLKSTGKRYKTISVKTGNDGKYPWKVPASVATGDYKIRVQAVTDNTLNDDSDSNFKIGDCTRFEPTGGYTIFSYNPGQKFLVTNRSTTSLRDWLHVSCHSLLYCQLSDGWWYVLDDGFYFIPSTGKLCAGNNLILWTTGLPDTVCTITGVTTYSGQLPAARSVLQESTRSSSSSHRMSVQPSRTPK